MFAKTSKSILNSKLASNKTKFNPLISAANKKFGNKHAGSGSESDHHGDHGEEKPSFFRERRITEPWNTFKHVKSDKYEVLSLIEKLREPLVEGKEKKITSDLTFEQSVEKATQEHKEYIQYLADCFEEHASVKYPEYKVHIDEFKHDIPNYSKLNPYEREVKTLDAYMNWSISKNREDSFRLQGKHNTDNVHTELEQLNYRVKLLSKLTTAESSDTKVLKSIKGKLKKVLESDSKYMTFLSNYNTEKENDLLGKVIESKKAGYSHISSVKTNSLADVKSSLNPFVNHKSPAPHDHIEIDNWDTNPNKTEVEREKYLALYDVVLDQHIRRIRPENLDDNKFKYANRGHVQTGEQTREEELRDNTAFDYVCQQDGAYFKKFLEEVADKFENKEKEDNVSFYLKILKKRNLIINTGMKT